MESRRAPRSRRLAAARDRDLAGLSSAVAGEVWDHVAGLQRNGSCRRPARLSAASDEMGDSGVSPGGFRKGRLMVRISLPRLGSAAGLGRRLDSRGEYRLGWADERKGTAAYH
jgi:hypothetical protein